MTIIENLMPLIENYGFIFIVLFSILHPLTENPWSFLTLSLALTVLGIPLGYGTILLGNTIGILLLYVIAKHVRKQSKHYLEQKQATKRALLWLEQTSMWRHIIVIGMPSVTTYPIKVALPLSNVTFSRYFVTLSGSYLFLHVANSLLYFGVLSIVTDTIHPIIGTGLLILFALYIYFGKSLRMKWQNR